MYINVATGADARVAGADPISGNDLGVRYSGFRTLDRFDAQIDGLNVGHISWPGGALAEAYPDRFGLNYDGLFNPNLGQPGLSEMMAYCNDAGVTLSVVLPTARYANDLDQLRADMREFMTDLLAGDYGPLPPDMFFHIGSEHYAHFQGLTADGAAAAYGRVAAVMAEEIENALADPSVNLIGADIDIAVQAGRTLPEDELIRGAFSDDLLAEVDMVTHHRYASQADGIDGMLRGFRPINDAWRNDVAQAGGEEPQINLGEWNVASMTRNEALTRYVRDMAADGIRIDPRSVDLTGRTNTEFENYWQTLLETRDYGAAQPQLYLEMFSEYVAEGLGAASIHAVDLIHAGRITFTDVDGNPVRFVGAEMIDMIYESVEGTSVLQVSEQNRAGSPIATYGFESEDRLVLFVAADEGVTLGDVTLNIEGLEGGYSAIWTESLVAEVPDDWMTRFNVPDNAAVDESNESQTYALGIRGDAEARIDGNELTVSMPEAGQVVRIIVARTPEEAAEIAGWAGPPDYTGTLTGGEPDVPDVGTPPIVLPGVGGNPSNGDDVGTDDEGDNSWASQWVFPGGGIPAPVSGGNGGGGASTSGTLNQSIFGFLTGLRGQPGLDVPPTSPAPVVPVPAPGPIRGPVGRQPSPEEETDGHAPNGIMSLLQNLLHSTPVDLAPVSQSAASAQGMVIRSSDAPSPAKTAAARAGSVDPVDASTGASAMPTELLLQGFALDDDRVDASGEDEGADADSGSSVGHELVSMMNAVTGIAMGGMLVAMSQGVF